MLGQDLADVAGPVGKGAVGAALCIAVEFAAVISEPGLTVDR
jgi:hypothetical protein